MFAVFKRDFRSYFSSPIAYVIIGLFFFILSLFFIQTSLNTEVASFSSQFISTMSFMLLFIVPILTMRAIAEDRKSGTEVLLLTSPKSVTSVVVGKFLAAYGVFSVMTAVTFIFPIVLLIFGRPEGATIFSAYLGFFLIGAVYVSIGVFASSITENQIVAAIISFVSIFALMFAIDFTAYYLGGNKIVGKVLTWLSITDRYNKFGMGIIDLTSIIFLLSFTVVFIFLTVRIIERKRWSKG